MEGGGGLMPTHYAQPAMISSGQSTTNGGQSDNESIRRGGHSSQMVMQVRPIFQSIFKVSFPIQAGILDFFLSRMKILKRISNKFLQIILSPMSSLIIHLAASASLLTHSIDGRISAISFQFTADCRSIRATAFQLCLSCNFKNYVFLPAA